MNNLLKLGILSLTLAACSSEQSPISTPQKLAINMQSLPPFTVIHVISQDSYPSPKKGQIIEKRGTFKVINNIYNEQGTKVLISQDSIISGIYTNDRVSCAVTWSSIYANKTEFENNRGSFALANQAPPTPCSPLKGIKANKVLSIHIQENNIPE